VARLFVVAIDGNVSAEQITFNFKEYKTWFAKKNEVPAARPFSWNLGLGPSLIAYKETAEPDFSEVVLTVKGGIQYALNPKWSVALGGYMSLLPLTTNVPERTIRFLGLNLRLGYQLPFLQKPWILSLMGGWYYTTTFSSTPVLYGFTGMAGPQIFPVLVRTLSSRTIGSMYVKYALVSAGFGIAPQGSEIASGIALSYLLSNGKSLSFSVDAAQFSLAIEDTIFITSRSLSLGVGFKW
jgi:hypothetical protein